MSRDGNGTYSLPGGNPVITGTTISSAWANTTLTDVAAALTDSLSRSGLGGMTAGLKLAAGLVGSPGLTWSLETTSGLYRAGAADFRWVNAGVELLQLTPNLMQISGTAPVLRFNESGAAANNKLWDVIASGEDLNFRALTDALVVTNWLTVTRTAGVVDLATLGTKFVVNTPGDDVNASLRLLAATGRPVLDWTETAAAANNRRWSIQANSEAFLFRATDDAGTSSTNWLRVDRTGTTVDTVNFQNGVLQYGGIEVGYRGMPRADFSTSTNTAATDAGRLRRFTGAGGQTFTADTDIPADGVVTILNDGSASLSIAASTQLIWANGSGAVSSGTRTLAIGGVATLFCHSSGIFYIWGTGLT